MSKIQVNEVHVAPPGAITEHNGHALCLDADDVVWVTFCGGTDWDRKGGWTPNHPNSPEPGHYNGNGCTDRYPKAPCRLLEFDSED